MPGDSIVVGPFVGGLNNISTAGEADDKEVVELINFEVSKDTSLTSRPPMKVLAGSIISSTKPWDILGIFRESRDKWFLIVQRREAERTALYAALSGDITDLTFIRSVAVHDNRVAAFAQVDDWGYFCITPESGNSGSLGFKWNSAEGIKTIPTMPQMYCMVSHKGRLWGAGHIDSKNATTLFFSTINENGSDYSAWKPETDYIKVAPGEGGYITSILSLNSSILVFKDDGTWRFSYPTSPAKGQVDKISGTIGASGKEAVAEFENLVYVYDKGTIYELINNNYAIVSMAIEFRSDPTLLDLDGVELSIAARRLFVHYRNTVYTYNVDTKSWAQWRSTLGVPSRWLELPQSVNSKFPSTYVAATKGLTNISLLSVSDYYPETTGVVENIECIVRTKSYDYKAPSVYKRMFWWGMDHKSVLYFKARAVPVIKQRSVTWKELRDYTYARVQDGGTFGNPLRFLGSPVVRSDTNDVSNTLTDNGRIFSKMSKQVRFRQIYYEIIMVTEGNKLTGPCKIFTLTTYVKPKEKVFDKNS